MKLVAIYNANGGFLGELTYITRKIMGKQHCALCDITHGMNPFGKSSWKKAVSHCSFSLETVHLNEMDAATSKVMENVPAPAIVILSDDLQKVLVTSEEIEACQKNGAVLLNLIEKKLANLSQ